MLLRRRSGGGSAACSSACACMLAAASVTWLTWRMTGASRPAAGGPAWGGAATCGASACCSSIPTGRAAASASPAALGGGEVEDSPGMGTCNGAFWSRHETKRVRTSQARQELHYPATPLVAVSCCGADSQRQRCHLCTGAPALPAASAAPPPLPPHPAQGPHVEVPRLPPPGGCRWRSHCKEGT